MLLPGLVVALTNTIPLSNAQRWPNTLFLHAVTKDFAVSAMCCCRKIQEPVVCEVLPEVIRFDRWWQPRIERIQGLLESMQATRIGNNPAVRLLHGLCEYAHNEL